MGASAAMCSHHHSDSREFCPPAQPNADNNTQSGRNKTFTPNSVYLRKYIPTISMKSELTQATGANNSGENMSTRLIIKLLLVNPYYCLVPAILIRFFPDFSLCHCKCNICSHRDFVG